MTEEEKAAQQAKEAEEAADEESTEAETEEEEAEDDDKSKDTDKIDYEAALAKEREAREKAEKALAEKRFKSSEDKRKAKTDEDEEEETEKPLTASQLQAILSKERQETQRTLQATMINDIAGKMTGSDAEKNLVIEIHKNRTFPSHLSLEEQIEEAYVIANRKKLISERNEALRALKNKDGVNNNPAGTHQDAPKAGEPKLAPDVMKTLKQSGFTWNVTSKRYEKKLPNGKTLVRDTRSNKVMIV